MHLDWNHPLVIIVAQHAIGRLMGVGSTRDREDLLRRLDQLHERVHALQASLAATNGRVATAPATGASSLPGPATEEPSPTPTTAPPRLPNEVATSCLACARAHLRAVQVALGKAAEADGQPPVRSPEAVALRNRLVDLSARLKEAARFAREDGLHHPEVARRLSGLADEAVVLERYEASPEVLTGMPPKERQAVEAVLPGLRRLRQTLSEGVKTPEELVQAAAEAGRLGRALYANPYLHFADEELSALLAYDLSEANLARSDPAERQAVEPVIEAIRAVHHQLRALSAPGRAAELAKQVEAVQARLAAT